MKQITEQIECVGSRFGRVQVKASLLTMEPMYLPWCSAKSSSVSLGSLVPSPANTPAPYGDPPLMESILNIPAPKVYPIGTKIMP